MGKQIVFDAIQSKNTGRTPWVPFVGVHGAALIGTNAELYLKSSELIIKGLKEAIRRYKPDGIPVIFDLQIEAEALGCEIQWAEDNPPAVISHILETKKLEELEIPTEKSGRFPIVLEVIKALKKENYDIALYGLVIGPFTLALHLCGTNIFMDMYDKPDEVKKVMSFCSKVVNEISRMYVHAGCDVIALVDPMTSQISPEAFVEFVSPYAKECFGYIRELKAYSSLFVCGHAQRNVEAMCETRPDNLSIDENIPLDYVKEICEKANISYGGNMQLTLTLMMGNADDVSRHTIECMETGKGKGYILSPGCDLPFAVPPENLETVADIVHDPYKQMIAAELLKIPKTVNSDINLEGYGDTENVLIDVITLDSLSCAPCQYMVEAVRKASEEFGEIVRWKEYSVKEKKSVEFMVALGVKNIPTICIDGEIKFVSLIPSHPELKEAIQNRVNEKYLKRVQEMKARILVFGSGCESCEKTLSNIEKAVLETGSRAEIVKVSDEESYAKYGIRSTPAVVIEKTVVKSSGIIPSVDSVKEWIKDIS